MRQSFLQDIYQLWISTCDKENLVKIWQGFKADIYPEWLRSCREDLILGASLQLEGAILQAWQEQCPNQSLAALPQVLQNGLNLTSSQNVTWHGSLSGPALTTCPYWRNIVLVNLILILVIGGPGNILTVIAIPYVRMRYNRDFPRLRNTIAVLIVHLSVCDLMYMAIGFSHFIQVNILEHFPYSRDTCYHLALFRNWVAHADFYTIAAIASCVASHTSCWKCKATGTFKDHPQHSLVFSHKGLVVIILLIWVAALFTITWDIFHIHGTRFGWTGRAYGCDTIHSVCTENEIGWHCVHWPKVLSYVSCSLVIVISYTVCIRRFWIRERRSLSIYDVSSYGSERLTMKVIAMWVVLSIFYMLFAGPELFQLRWLFWS